jgi:RimJ/RimL family protein N-acetyltransferase
MRRRDIELVKLESAMEEALMGDPTYRSALSAGRWADAAARVREVVGARVPATAQRIERPTWEWYFVGDGRTGDLVGSCAFKAPPADDGTVEIAYFTYPSFEGLGYATAMALRLIELASMSPAVRRVIAHTLPDAGASTRVLDKAGMTFTESVVDPEDGDVWRWQIEMGGR